MDIRIRLTRKPVTTALWVILTAAMALLLSVGAAMLYSSGSLTSILDGYHTSIAVRLNPNTPQIDGFTTEDVKAFEAMDSVEKVYFHTVSGAYSPELTPMLAPAFDHESNKCYSDMLVVGTITAMEPYNAENNWVRGMIHVEEMILENPTVTRSAFWEAPEMEFWYSGWDASLENLAVGQRWVFFGSYMDIFGVHSVSYPAQWHEGKLLRIENIDYAPDNPNNITGPALLAPIEGTWEEFLQDPANAIYLDMMDRWEKQQHSLTVLGTDNLSVLYAFAANKASLTQGRAFTDEEYASGAKVCMLSESVANRSGISVGDTITMEQYLLTDALQVNLNLNPSLLGGMSDMYNEPNVGMFTLLNEYAPREEFTVVGLYRQIGEWANDPYGFTPNTILIPKSAQIPGAMGGPTGEQDNFMADGTYGVYFSIKLKNGEISEFEEQMEASERFADRFLTVDQGFGAVMETLAQVEASTMKLMGMCLAGWAMLMMLYLLLYQGSQRKNIGIMRSLGASPKVAGDYLWKSGLTVAAIGIAVGTAASLVVVQFTQSKLLQNAVAQLPGKYSIGGLTDEAVQLMAQESQLPVWLLLLLALAQMALFGLVLRSHAKHTSRKSPRNLLSK